MKNILLNLTYLAITSATLLCGGAQAQGTTQAPSTAAVAVQTIIQNYDRLLLDRSDPKMIALTLVNGKCGKSGADGDYRARILIRKYEGVLDAVRSVKASLVEDALRNLNAKINDSSMYQSCWNTIRNMINIAPYLDQKYVELANAVKAAEQANSVTNPISRGPDVVTPPSPFPSPFPTQQMAATTCVTPYGWCPMGMPVPVASSCYCPSQWGPVWGIAR